MTSETKKRILSALVFRVIALICGYIGTGPITILLLVFGILIIDEVYCNILTGNRLDFFYILTQSVFVVPYLLFNFTKIFNSSPHIIIYTSLGINLFLMVYLFFVKMESNLIRSVKRWIPFLIAFFVLMPWLNISLLFKYDNWRALIFILLLVNFGMDTGAWFFGKKFGKNKLWEKISPKKTIEGLLGGALCSGILGALGWFLLVEKPSIYLIILFSFFGILSQFGDLIQSKIKRQADVKDASGLIPGHGGVYDRLDSLLFLSPFFIIMVNSYYK